MNMSPKAEDRGGREEEAYEDSDKVREDLQTCV